jgi:SSS family solute:Na+ symporter
MHCGPILAMVPGRVGWGVGAVNASLLILGAYVLFQLVLGYVVSRGVNDELDYLVGGRKLGPALTGASVFATWFGAETCVGAAGEVYRRGLAAVSADPFGYGLCVVLFGFVLAGPLWKRGLVTLADLFRDRFSVGVERLVSALLIPGSVLWAAAQMRAFGHVLTASADLDPT